MQARNYNKNEHRELLAKITNNEVIKAFWQLVQETHQDPIKQADMIRTACAWLQFLKNQIEKDAASEPEKIRAKFLQLMGFYYQSTFDTPLLQEALFKLSLFYITTDNMHETCIREFFFNLINPLKSIVQEAIIPLSPS